MNDVLRRGLRGTQEPSKRRKPFRTQPIEGAVCLLDNVDNIGEVLAIIEGELYK